MAAPGCHDDGGRRVQDERNLFIAVRREPPSAPGDVSAVRSPDNQAGGLRRDRAEGGRNECQAPDGAISRENDLGNL